MVKFSLLSQQNLVHELLTHLVFNGTRQFFWDNIVANYSASSHCQLSQIISVTDKHIESLTRFLFQRVFCGHEYSVSNLKFALHVEPDNDAVKAKLAECKKLRSKSPPETTIPSTIGEEKSYNPFMRVGEASVQGHTKTEGAGDAIATMAALRQEKDGFKAK